MSRTLLAVLFAISFLSPGCRRQQTATEADGKPSSAPAVEMSPPAAAAPRAAPAKAPTSEPPKGQTLTTHSGLEELIAGYLESDGQGGWRKNEKAATELEKLSPEESQHLWLLLKNPQVNIRRGAAVFLLGSLDPNDSRQVEAFTSLLNDSDSLVRARGIDAVKQFGPADQIAALLQLSALLDVNREERAENRAAAGRLLGVMKRDAVPALPALTQSASSDPDAKVRSAALVALVQVAKPTQAVKPLVAGLADKDASVRLVAAARLRQLGPESTLAVEPLALALSDENAAVNEAAAEALIRIGATAVEPLAAQLSSTNANARRFALAALAKLGPAAKPARSRIEKCKQDSDPKVRELAEAALTRIAP